MVDANDDLATQLKSRNFYGALSQIRDGLGLPANTKHSEMEALLIFIIKDIYNDGIKADVALMALGLLNGFSRTQKRLESKEESKLYSNRREEFLKLTNYIEIITDGKLHSYSEAEQTLRHECKGKEAKTELDTIRSTLGTDDKRYLADAISALYKKENISDYLKAAKDTFEENVSGKGIKKINWRKWEHIPEKLLPSLKYCKLIISASPPFKDDDDENKQKMGILSVICSKLLVLLRKQVRVSWMILAVVVAFSLRCCSSMSVDVVHYIDREKGIEYLQFGISTGFSRDPIEVSPTDNTNINHGISYPSD